MTRKRTAAIASLTAIAILALSACSGDSSSDGPSSSSTAQPASTPWACGTYSGRGCAPASARVDLTIPSFSNPTAVTNPLFPISRLRSALLLGHVDGKPFRTETTLLPTTAKVAWNGRRYRVLLSQYMAFLDGRLQEVAIDRYAQADDGSVWYFGEDVYDYERGAVAVTEGTWLAGKEGPAAMIMPGRPRVGDVFRPENVLGVVFEEVRVKAIDETVSGPHGPIQGAIVAEELHLDGSKSDKFFAPGYGEFRTTDGGDLEALALAVPGDARPGPVPADLAFLVTGGVGILENARLRDWGAASATVGRMSAAWERLRRGNPPRMVAARLDARITALRHAVRRHGYARTAQAAIDVAQSAYDLELQYRPASEIDAARFDLWTQQLRVDAAANDVAAVTGDVAVLEWIFDRIAHDLDPLGRRELVARLRALRNASDARNLPAAADHAARLGARSLTGSTDGS